MSIGKCVTDHRSASERRGLDAPAALQFPLLIAFDCAKPNRQRSDRCTLRVGLRSWTQFGHKPRRISPVRVIETD
jgi:hypothetical protein